MLIDAPGVEDLDEKGKGGGDFVLTDDNAQEVLKLINQINR